MAPETLPPDRKRNPPARGRTLQNAQRIAINAFLIFHLLAIACWCLPIDNALVSLCKEHVRPYLLWSGLFQSWDMFSPNPKSANTYVEATIVYPDKSRTSWSFPRMEQLSLTERCFKERYRKFAENLPVDANDALLPDAARHIARLNSTPSHPAKTIMLIQRWSFIVPRADGSYVPEPWDQHILLGYGVRLEDLQ
jgi:hypothetical protein